MLSSARLKLGFESIANSKTLTIRFGYLGSQSRNEFKFIIAKSAMWVHPPLAMKTKSPLIQAYHYFNPYHYEGEYCNPWSSLLQGYRLALQSPYHSYDAKRLGFAEWLINEANVSAFEIQYDL